jgi:pimeloyl-ACP methyl ester carboxylesterase
MPSRTINNVGYHYQEQGRGTPLVLIHGFPFDSRMWEAQSKALSDRNRVIAPDLRGFGKSAASGAFSIAALADDVHALLAEIGALPCLLGGLSMGGYIALAFSRKYASDLKGLALLDTRSEADSSEAKQNREKMIALAGEKGSAAIAETMLPKLLSSNTIERRHDVVHRMRKMMEEQDPQTVQHALAAMRDREDQSAHLPSIAVPTAIIVGADDQITPPKLSEAMQQAIPHSTLSVIPRAGHMSPVEAPDEVNRALRTWATATGG